MTEQDERLLRLQGISVTNNIGLECGQCSCNDFRTNNTIKKDNLIVRYKSCRNCGSRVRTIERKG